jgi:probable F420-dependent oxidoreductase
MKPLRLLAAIDVVDRRGFADAVRRAEALGFDALAFPDHVLDQLAPVPAMATVAALSDRLRVSAFVFNNDLRHPAVLGHDLATLDLLTDGRLDVAMGAGWNRAEYEAMGMLFENGSTRVARLAEAVTVLKGYFAGDPFTFEGQHYQITELEGRPRGVQRPHPPFLIGGGGRRVLELAAREAQVIGLAPRAGRPGRGDPESLTWEATVEKIEWVRAAAGPRFDDLVLNVYPSRVAPEITDNARAALRRVADDIRSRSGVELTEEQLRRSPHIYIGSVDSLVEKIDEMRSELGISSFFLGQLDELAPVVERLRSDSRP